MNHPRLSRLLLWCGLTCIATFTASAQTEPVITSGGAQTTPGGFWSKNMEFIRPIKFHANSNEMFQFAKIKKGSTSEYGYYIVTTEGTEQGAAHPSVHLIDVSIPRASVTNALRIEIKDHNNNYLTPRDIEVWTDNSTGYPFSGHTFAAVYIGNTVVKSSPEVEARFVILNLTTALSKITTTDKVIVIEDSDVRAAKLSGSTTIYKDVYIGYVKQDRTYLIEEDHHNPGIYKPIPPHTLAIEKELGLMVIAPLHPSEFPSGGSTETRGFIDLIDLRMIAPHADATATSDTLIEAQRITTSNGWPIECKTTVPDQISEPHEASLEKVSTNKVRVYVASSTSTFSWVGGVVVFEVDYTTPTSATITPVQHWGFDADRRYPSQRFAPVLPVWSLQMCHSVQPMRINSNRSFILTTNELVTPHYVRNRNGSLPDLLTCGSSGAYTDVWGDKPYDGTNNNDLILGNYLRIWEVDPSDTRKLKGSGSYNGPLGAYDAPEQVAASGNTLYTAAALSNADIAPIDANCADPAEQKVGPNSSHRMRTIPGNEDIFLSYYSQGFRVVGLQNFSTSTPTVREKAYFDFVPTLNYDSSSDYFYANRGRKDGTTEDYYYTYTGQYFSLYFKGIWDVRPDIERTGTVGGLPSDEKFVYGMGAGGEGYVSNDVRFETQPRNYLGGFFIVRYFDDKIGGTISGYTGTSAWKDRSYRQVNLEGTFAVERDVTIAAGATVTLWPGTTLNVGSSGEKTIYVDGTLNVKTTTGDGIKVPIVVRNGGKLIINDNAVADFHKMIKVEKCGEWTFLPGSRTVLRAPVNLCHGKLDIAGTSTGRITVSALPDPGGVVQSNNTYIMMRGDSDAGSCTWLNVDYADMKNVCIDALDVRPAASTVTNSNFEGHTRAARQFLFSLAFSPGIRLGAVIIRESSFKDNALTRSGLRWGVRYEIGGISLTNVVSARIIGSGTDETRPEFSYLLTGVQAINTTRLRVEKCHFRTGNMGVRAETGSGMIICTNIFEDIDYGVQMAASQTTTFYDNLFEENYIGVFPWQTGSNLMRGNIFDKYGTGIFSSGSLLQLRPLPGTTEQTIFGRNSFSTDSATNWYWGPTVPTTDISLGLNATLLMDCGKNRMALNSANHLCSYSMRNVNVASNDFPDPILGWAVRKCATVTTTGTPIDVSLSSTPECAAITDNDLCTVTLCAGQHNGEWVDWESTDPRLPTAYTAARTDMLNTSNSTDCRLEKAREALTAALLSDDNGKVGTLIGDYRTISTTPAMPAMLVAGVLTLKSVGHFFLGELDSSRVTDSIIVTSYPLTVDSVPAAWRMQMLGTLASDLDTTNPDQYDSLGYLYQLRVLADLRRRTPNGGAGLPKETAPDANGATTGTLVTALEQNIPNPFSLRTTVRFTLASEGGVKITVNDARGAQVATLVDDLFRAGRHTMELESGALPSGVYMLRMETGGRTYTRMISILR